MVFVFIFFSSIEILVTFEPQVIYAVGVLRDQIRTFDIESFDNVWGWKE